MSDHLPLRAKVAELVDLADMIGLPLELVAECMVRMMDGHREWVSVCMGERRVHRCPRYSGPETE